MNLRSLSGNKFILYWKSYINQIDWKLFLFLLLFLNVKLFIKIAALILIYILRPNFKFGFKLRSSRLPLFYLAVLALATFNWLFKGHPGQLNATFLYLVGAGYWILGILAMHQIKLSIDTAPVEKVHQTLSAFFLLNAIISICQYFFFAFEAGVLNLYQYQGEFQKYFIGTGDLIRGLTFDTSTTNALIGAMGVVYFVSRQKITLTLLCMAIVLMTGSNLTNIALVLILLALFLFRSNKIQKSLITACFFLLIIFTGKISPQNSDYTQAVLKKIFQSSAPPTLAAAPPEAKPEESSTPTLEEKKYLIAKSYIDSMNLAYKMLLEQMDRPPDTMPNLSILKEDIHSQGAQRKIDSTPAQKILVQAAHDPVNLPLSLMASDDNAWRNKPGKLVAFSQTLNFVKENPATSITGIGMGNFSSRLAFRATGLHISGGYPDKLKYISPYFQVNHLSLYLYYFSKDTSWHSVMNAPNSVYDQLLGEYGLLGILAFLLLYVGFFVPHFKKLTYGIPALLLLGMAFCWEYWYEQLNVVILLEALLFLNIKERTTVPEKDSV